MKIVAWSEVKPEQWDEAVDQSSEAWLFHRAAWVRAETTYWAHSGHSFAVCAGDGMVAAVCPLYLRELGRGAWVERLLDSGHHRHAGLALRDGLAPAVSRHARAVGMRHLLEVAEATDADRIQLSYSTLARRFVEPHRPEVPFWARDHGFSLGSHIWHHGELAVPGMSTVVADQIVDLDAEEDVLLARMDQKCRNAVRQGLRAGLTFAPADSDPVGEFYALAVQSAQRTGEVLPPHEAYRSIWDALAPSGRCGIFFVRHEGQQVAAIILLCDRAGVSYFAGVSRAEFLHLRVNNVLLWSAICWARKQGHHSLRLGPMFPEAPSDWPVSRVTHFKTGFGARSAPLIVGSRFRRPQHYLDDARAVIAWRCGAADGQGTAPPAAEPDRASRFQSLHRLLRRVRRASS